jgi:hypothetical protein
MAGLLLVLDMVAEWAYEFGSLGVLNDNKIVGLILDNSESNISLFQFRCA